MEEYILYQKYVRNVNIYSISLKKFNVDSGDVFFVSLVTALYFSIYYWCVNDYYNDYTNLTYLS